ncbi:hypothetical protein HMPREF9554_03145 [Treponema phagedenis F0421]|nr:hypothetical protein HMPREF9554_03145 [Treponema phagedenis F0421]
MINNHDIPPWNNVFSENILVSQEFRRTPLSLSEVLYKNFNTFFNTSYQNIKSFIKKSSTRRKGEPLEFLPPLLLRVLKLQC